MNRLNVFTDGASRGNPGPSALGVVINDANGKEICVHKRYLGECTNNMAEYNALVEAVIILKQIDLQFDEISFYCDSELVVKQIKGDYKLKNKELIKLSLKFWKEINELGKKFTINYIPRTENKRADKLANEALDESETSGIDRSLLDN